MREAVETLLKYRLVYVIQRHEFQFDTLLVGRNRGQRKQVRVNYFYPDLGLHLDKLKIFTYFEDVVCCWKFIRNRYDFQ